jgi:hypothetical protein
MTHDDIIRMAHEADCLDDQHYGTVWANKLEHFAELVAAHQREQDAQLVQEMVKKNYDLDDFANSVRAGMMRLCSDGRPKWLKISMEVAAEREACAKLCEADGLLWGKKYAAAIRARSDYDPRPPR